MCCLWGRNWTFKCYLHTFQATDVYRNPKNILILTAQLFTAYSGFWVGGFGGETWGKERKRKRPRRIWKYNITIYLQETGYGARSGLCYLRTGKRAVNRVMKLRVCIKCWGILWFSEELLTSQKGVRSRESINGIWKSGSRLKACLGRWDRKILMTYWKERCTPQRSASLPLSATSLSNSAARRCGYNTIGRACGWCSL